MASKYHGLPDIDTAPDVFETTDEPEPILRPSNDGVDGDDVIVKHKSELIDAAGLPPRKKAERVFGRGTRRPDGSQLPSRSYRLRLGASYGSTPSSSDDERPPKETSAARIRRLKAELADLEMQLGSGPLSSETGIELGKEESSTAKRQSAVPPREPVNFVQEIVGLRSRLGAVDLQSSSIGTNPHTRRDDVRSRLEQLAVPNQSTSMGIEGAQIAKVEQGESSSGLSELDQRLVALERLVGPISSTIEGESSSMAAALDKHDHLLALLTQPRHLDAISRRVKLLLVDLDRAAAAARRQGSSVATQQTADKNVTLNNAEYSSLQSLFALLPRLDPLLPIIPALLARLQSLSGLHLAASEIAEGLHHARDADRKNDEETQELSSVVEGVQKGLDQANKQILDNWANIEKKMKSIEERMEKLSS